MTDQTEPPSDQNRTPGGAVPSDPVRHGGTRRGAGRPAGQGPFGETTVTLRVPSSLKPAVVSALAEYRRRRDATLAAETRRRLETAFPASAEAFALDPPPANLPEFTVRVPAGFPSPADDHQEDGIDLNRLLIKNAMATFAFRVSGDSMNRAGILDGDRVVVDRSIEPRPGDIVIAVIAGEGFTVKRLRRRADGRPVLVPESDNPVHRPRGFGPARSSDAGEECFGGADSGTADDTEMCIWGVVTGCVRQFRQR